MPAVSDLQRTCPRCGELNPHDAWICQCGTWLVERRHLTQLEFEDWKLVESVHGWRIEDDQRLPPDDPDEWMPDRKLPAWGRKPRRGAIARGAEAIPPKTGR